MLPDHDARHGTTRGFHAGCRCDDCRGARARYEKQSRLDRLRGGRSVPAIGSQRRIQALMRLGWTCDEIAAACGWGHRNYVLRVLNGQKGKPTTWLERKTAERITDAYNALSMRLPSPGAYRGRNILMAQRKGYLPPLAWDDDQIDDPGFTPGRIETDEEIEEVEEIEATPTLDVDPVVVERFLARDITPGLWANQAEKREIARRWTGGYNELARMTGWNVRRYTSREDGAA